LIRRALEFLVRFKNGLKGQEDDAFGIVGGDDDGGADDDDDDGEPLTWAEQKNIRKELRRFQLWHALRLKVPRGFEEGV